MELRESLLGEFLRFLNTLSATHVTVRAVLASDQWFTMLLKIVDIDMITGTYLISINYKIVGIAGAYRVFYETFYFFFYTHSNC